MADRSNSTNAPNENELDEYDFALPRELIAQEPTAKRTDSRMMVIHRGTGHLDHVSVRDLPSFLRAGDAMVVNDSKVIPARLIGFRAQTRGRWEGLFIREENGVAELICKTRGYIQPGEEIVLRDPEGRETQKLVVVTASDRGHMLLRPEPAIPWLALLESIGRVPLPPYIRDGQMTTIDKERYQTVYARNPGSIAAPTAGLHITQELIQRIRTAGVALVSVTLHVGLGTFRPIQTARLSEHTMHSEYAQITEPVVKRLVGCRAEGGRIVAVGTTSARTLETAAGNGSLVPWTGQTDIFIRPGHQFKAVDVLLTNFHLPRSSLLVLVSAFAGRELIMEAYRKAIEQEYRFYSYGDCMLII